MTEDYSTNRTGDQAPLLQSVSSIPDQFTNSSSIKPQSSPKETSSDRETHSKCASSSSQLSKEKEKALHSPAPGDVEGVTVTTQVRRGSEALEDNPGRERLKKHRSEVAGRVWIPDIWGQEELLKDWINCSAFDASLEAAGIMSARAALVEEGRRANSRVLRVENRC